MDFAFTDEQQMIRDTAEAFLKDTSTSEAVRTAMVSELGYDAELWQRLCGEMYWQAIHIPEAYGGLGLSYIELIAIVEQMGRYLLCAPYFSTVCLATNALLCAGSEEQKAEHLGAICEGKTATLAWSNTGGWTADSVSASACKDGDDYLLNGDYRYVIDGASAELLILAAKEEGNDAVQLFAVDATAAGIERQALPTMDQTRRQAAIQLKDLRVPAGAKLTCESDDGADALNKTLQLATVALAAEQAGGMQQLLSSAVEYTQERKQFNRPIASFQSIKHKAADMMMRNEVARSSIYYAACVADEALNGGELSAELPEAASIAKAWCSEAYFKNAGEAMQMHGGVGFTWEYDVHLYFKRAKASEHLLGNSDQHRENIASLLLDGE
ncbi:acyl-CoA dehydrogenase family protein [Spongiibacter sp. UBA1325]|uniref:acyl-CoA dehydrogenase family protein n=1 Tax=Spongiibacter sp. UBA1325 TaxID=1947543 RepID=UPI00257A73B9|nr:acyl-CoA dehydrogenase family protein [Spongiibacter sp. UBA1325]|tara:strand:+ start:345 stop:1496 length:1152 start_codon:yes stop_codon:yes gene_type:complete